jgi:hypothetical protein
MMVWQRFMTMGATMVSWPKIGIPDTDVAKVQEHGTT